MKIFRKLLASATLFAFLGSAQAVPVMVNFQTMADGAYGESAWDTLSLATDFGVDVDIVADNLFGPAYAYLDSSTGSKGGLGVCGTLLDPGTADTKLPGSGANLCDTAADDNVTSDEALTLLFGGSVSVNKIWFNNNHDGDFSLDGDSVFIGNSAFSIVKTFDSFDFVDSDLGWVFDFSSSSESGDFLDGDDLTIANIDEQFYISAIEFEITSTPEPAVLALLGLGLIGIGATRRKK